MKMNELRAKAKLLEMKTSHMKRGDRFRQIQRAEGNFDYFSTSKDYCEQ